MMKYQLLLLCVICIQLATCQKKLGAKVKKLEADVKKLQDLIEKIGKPYTSIQKLNLGSKYFLNSFNFKDQMALSMCTALSPNTDDLVAVEDNLIFQVRRDCHMSGIPTSQTCEDICKTVVASNEVGGARCFDALHIYDKDEPIRRFNPDNNGPYVGDNSMDLRAFHYGPKRGCAWRPNHCGPNYCCCRSRAI